MVIPYCPVSESWNIGNLGGKKVNKTNKNDKEIINITDILDIICGFSGESIIFRLKTCPIITAKKKIKISMNSKLEPNIAVYE